MATSRHQRQVERNQVKWKLVMAQIYNVIASHTPRLFGLKFKDPADEAAFQYDELQIVRSPLRVLFIVAAWVFLIAAAITGGRGSKTPRSIGLSFTEYFPMVLGAAGWLLCVCSKRYAIQRWRHVSLSFMQVGLGVAIILDYAWHQNINSCALIPDPAEQGSCVGLIVGILFLFQILFAIFIPVIARVKFVAHWPAGWFRCILLTLVFTWFLNNSNESLGIIVGISIAFEVVANLIIYLDERTARENFILNKELDVQRRLTAEFLSWILHEVRNPMNGVIGNCQLLADTQLTPEQEEYLRDMECSCIQMKTVIGDVLDLHKVQAGKMALEETEFKVEAVISAALSQVKSAAIAKGVQITAAIASQVPDRLLGDSARLTQMLSNYLSNAVKFTPPITGRIAIYVVLIPPTIQGRRRLKWVVRDNGIGLQEHEVSRLFQSYQQASASVARQHGGTGLGLTIVRELSDLMRGEASPGSGVGVVSVYGSGSSFWFETELGDVGSDSSSSGTQTGAAVTTTTSGASHATQPQAIATTTVVTSTVVAPSDNVAEASGLGIEATSKERRAALVYSSGSSRARPAGKRSDIIQASEDEVSTRMQTQLHDIADQELERRIVTVGQAAGIPSGSLRRKLRGFLAGTQSTRTTNTTGNRGSSNSKSGASSNSNMPTLSRSGDDMTTEGLSRNAKSQLPVGGSAGSAPKAPYTHTGPISSMFVSSAADSVPLHPTDAIETGKPHATIPEGTETDDTASRVAIPQAGPASCPPSDMPPSQPLTHVTTTTTTTTTGVRESQGSDSSLERMVRLVKVLPSPSQPHRPLRGPHDGEPDAKRTSEFSPLLAMHAVSKETGASTTDPTGPASAPASSVVVTPSLSTPQMRTPFVKYPSPSVAARHSLPTVSEYKAHGEEGSPEGNSRGSSDQNLRVAIAAASGGETAIVSCPPNYSARTPSSSSTHSRVPLVNAVFQRSASKRSARIDSIIADATSTAGSTSASHAVPQRSTSKSYYQIPATESMSTTQTVIQVPALAPVGEPREVEGTSPTTESHATGVMHWLRWPFKPRVATLDRSRSNNASRFTRVIGRADNIAAELRPPLTSAQAARLLAQEDSALELIPKRYHWDLSRAIRDVGSMRGADIPATGASSGSVRPADAPKSDPSAAILSAPLEGRSRDVSRILLAQTRRDLAIVLRSKGGSREEEDDDSEDTDDVTIDVPPNPPAVAPSMGAARDTVWHRSPNVAGSAIANPYGTAASGVDDSLSAAAFGMVLGPESKHGGLYAGLEGDNALSEAIVPSASGSDHALDTGIKKWLSSETREVTTSLRVRTTNVAGAVASVGATTQMRGSRDALPSAAPRSPRSNLAIAEAYKQTRMMLPPVRKPDSGRKTGVSGRVLGSIASQAEETAPQPGSALSTTSEHNQQALFPSGDEGVSATTSSSSSPTSMPPQLVATSSICSQTGFTTATTTTTVVTSILGTLIPPPGGAMHQLSASSPQVGRVLHVLVVDDDRSQRIMLKRFFERWNIRVTMAKEGRDALRRYIRSRDRGGWIDVIAMDVNMNPGLGGVQATQELRRLEILSQDRHIPVMAVTANADIDDRKKYLEAGMDAVVGKPVDRAELLMQTELLARQRRVLVVEDDPVNQRLITRLITRAGHVVKVLASGEEVKELVEEGVRLRERIRSEITEAATTSPNPADTSLGAIVHAESSTYSWERGGATAGTSTDTPRSHRSYTAFEGFDIIFMDLHLKPGGMDGYETTKYLQSQPGGADVPVIAMTGAVGSEEEAKCQAAGMQGFLSKPIQKDELVAAITKYADSW